MRSCDSWNSFHKAAKGGALIIEVSPPLSRGRAFLFQLAYGVYRSASAQHKEVCGVFAKFFA